MIDRIRIANTRPGLVSKHRNSVYRAGRFPRWVKVKNGQHAAFSRVMQQF
jgi:ATP-dependent DNA ligase